MVSCGDGTARDIRFIPVLSSVEGALYRMKSIHWCGALTRRGIIGVDTPDDAGVAGRYLNA